MSAIVLKWQADEAVRDIMNITYVHSMQPTGYYGRFLVPLLSEGSYWAVFDDDVIFGSRYVMLTKYMNQQFICFTKYLKNVS